MMAGVTIASPAAIPPLGLLLASAALTVSLARSALASPDVRPRYAGATFAAQAGAGLGGYELITVGGDVFTGYRLSRWVSLEGFFGYRFATAPSASQEAVGAACAGATDHWRTEVLGARLWIHLLHRRTVDVSIAPSVAAGVSFNRGEFEAFRPGVGCGQVLLTKAGWAFDGGLDFGVEVRPARWLGLRAMMETSIDLGHAGGEAYDVLSVSGWVGPVLRF